ncbi:M64 family metallopeptidase [Agromyces mariniharenae]|uniref:VCBS repeat-containing protein n=1 Tax=Agromyces mariniharenae TaxID=2604423 RepID=A0A5S4UVU7_9MICO|nr:M64 family metallopeptidase [Agromyces mariniharenae]TYL51164.1 hypothetical protein FYC51_18785 [Agromyces mariniharenae]
MADSATILQDVGINNPRRKTLAILGDGFDAVGQAAFNKFVQDEVIDGVFGSGYFNEDSAAWNIIRVNLESKDSVASTRKWNLKGTDADTSDDTSTDALKDTALGIISNGTWWHDWFEDSAKTEKAIKDACDKWAPGWDFILIVVNSPLKGGLRNGTVLKVTMAVNWATIAHEFGHGFGDLEDEYGKVAKGAYSDTNEPQRVNVTLTNTLEGLKWATFVAPTTPVPTGTGANADYTAGAKPAGWDDSLDAGLFEGGATFATGIYRPAVRCRMRTNANEFCPVCYTELKRGNHEATGRNFRRIAAGHFTPDLAPEFLEYGDRSITLYRKADDGWQHVQTTADAMPGWDVKPGDQFFTGDFDGDGLDEVVVYNSVDFTFPYLGLFEVRPDGTLHLLARYDGDIPGWGGFARNDRFLVGDFDGDGKQDLLIYNLADWSSRYVALLTSTGRGFKLTRLYENELPGWGELASWDIFRVGDFTGTGRDDLLIWNGRDWSEKFLGILRLQRGGFRTVRLYVDDLPGWGGFAANDRIYIGDFDGDGKDDIFLSNAVDWSSCYLGMFRSTGNGFARVRLYEDEVPGWGGLRAGDQFQPADLTGSGKVGLFAWNPRDWIVGYAGRMVSDGTRLRADWEEDWIGEWHLGPFDRFTVVPPPRLPRWGVGEVITPIGTAKRHRVPSGPVSMLAHNNDWLGSMTTTASVRLERIYNQWVHNYRHGRNW